MKTDKEENMNSKKKLFFLVYKQGDINLDWMHIEIAWVLNAFGGASHNFQELYSLFLKHLKMAHFFLC